MVKDVISLNYLVYVMHSIHFILISITAEVQIVHSLDKTRLVDTTLQERVWFAI